MDADEGLTKLDNELEKSIRSILITPFGYHLSGWTKAEAAGVCGVFSEILHEEAVTELGE